MEWNDEALILGVRRHGENSVILETMTQTHGRHLGLVRGGRSRRMQASLQPGNSVQIRWYARLEEHLGTFSVEPTTLRAAFLMESGLNIQLLQTLAAHLRLLPERDNHAQLYKAALVLLDGDHDNQLLAELLIRFEISILEALGFGLDLAKCAATGSKEELIYVSPKSGSAVSANAGKPYHDKMLALPDYLVDRSNAVPNDQSLKEGFNLAAFFLHRHVYEPRMIEPPFEREQVLKKLLF